MRVKLKVLFVLSVSLLLIPLSAMADSVEKLNMIAGQTELLRNIKVDRISIGDPNIVEVEVLGASKEILIQALTPGFTDLRFWKNGVAKQFIVEVIHAQVGANLQAVKAAVAGIEGISVRGVGPNVLIEGSAYRQQDLAHINAIAESFENVVNVVVMSNIEMQNIVSMQVQFVEMRKGLTRNIGIDWSDISGGFNFGILRDVVTNDLFRLGDSVTNIGDATGQGTVLDYGNDAYNYLGFSARANSVLQLLENNGYARVLAEPSLSCVSGEEASFQAGGRLPIPVQSQDGLSVEFEDYGIILDVSPVADSSGNISARIALEISDIDPTVTVLGVPGILTRETETTVNVKSGETIVLSGLYRSNGSKSIDKLPGLGHIPILGELFKSRAFLNNETELYVFLTPQIITPQHEVNVSARNKFKKINDEHDKKRKFNILD